jgi:lipoprotein signal peptidase
MALVAVVVALTDIVIKLCALTLLGERSVSFTPWLRFAIYFNENMAWGLTTGSHPALITLAATVVVLTMGGVVVRELTVVDRLAPIALGLILGAGLANGLDGLFPPHGAVDFIVFSHGAAETAINGADLAVLLGLGLSCRMLVLIGSAIDRRRSERPRVSVPERAVPVPLHAEPGVRPRREAPRHRPESHREPPRPRL